MIFGMGIAYTLFLIWAVLWKCGVPFVGGGERVFNILPFNNNTRWEMQFNIAVFAPFGFYVAASLRKLSLPKLVLIIPLASLALEVVQFVLAVGRSDVTDLLMNTLGGIIGILAFLVLTRIFRKREQIVTLVVCALMTLFEVYMAVSFIFWGQLNLGFMIIR
ncbi:VanZ family protein [Syntrophobotulus glycolicus]|uniref:VanZ family protein n=1 Tax=Syntrophobotulus glycolicus TaxID=51197 RepID=UPI0006939020|nr:VanZ family protein [Syntrophobotulus glycolicus]